MISIAGFIFLLVCVFGGYMLAGGKMGLILKALPFELMMIGGAAVGAFLIVTEPLPLELLDRLLPRRRNVVDTMNFILATTLS